MGGVLKEIVFDSAHPARLARFWAEVLSGYAVMPYDQAELDKLAALGLTPESDPVVIVTGPGPRLCFHLVAGTRPARRRNRLHLDVVVADVGVESARLLALGASLRRQTADYTVLADPEGNNFCLTVA